MSPTVDVDIFEVVAAAKHAGRAIMEQLSSGVQVDYKNDDSPVTLADKAADAVIKQHLRRLTPTIAILSEEDTPQERAAAQASSIKWILDPLDGTKTAIKYARGAEDRDQFGVNISLVENNVPIRGVAHFPAMENGAGVTYFTGNDGKAYKQVGDDTPQLIRVSTPPFKHGTLRASVHHHEHRRPERIANRAYIAKPSVGGHRICLAAEGVVDIADMTDLAAPYAYKQWDLAAAHAIIMAAGGDLVSDGKRVTYDRPDYTMPVCLAAGDATLKELGLTNELAPIKLMGR